MRTLPHHYRLRDYPQSDGGVEDHESEHGVLDAQDESDMARA